VTIPFDFELFDFSAMHDNVTNNQSLIAPITGVYLVDALVGWNANTAGLRSIEVTGDAQGPADIRQALPSGGTLNHASGIFTLFQGEELHVDASQTSDGALAILSAQFSMIWLGPFPPA
jgi:hypothetical protein